MQFNDVKKNKRIKAMKKRNLLLVMFALLGSGAVQAADVKDIKFNGFVDIVWTLSDGTDLGINGAEGHFDTSAELDAETQLQGPVSMRLDADLNPSGSGDSGRLEQAFLNWAIDPHLGLKAGVFNNNLTFEKEDAPDMYQITHGQLYDIWNYSTFNLDGNNLAGLELSYDTGNLTAMVGYLNDIGDVAEENSLKIAAEMRATPDITVVAGLVTQDTNLENIIDINATWKMDDRLTLGGEIILPDEVIDAGLMFMANYQVQPKFNATFRLDNVSYDIAGSDDTRSITLAGLYTISDGMYVNGEVRFNTDDNPVYPQVPNGRLGEGDGTTARLEFLATF
jgi:hypothetical protein